MDSLFEGLLDINSNQIFPCNIPGYTINQINGCKIIEWVGSLEPEKGSEVYVTNIPDNVSEEKIFKIFSTVGIINKLRLMVCFSGASKGYGYVQYANRKIATIALKELNGTFLQNKRLRVTRSRDNCRLYFGNIPKDKPRHEIEKRFRENMSDIKQFFIYSDPLVPKWNRGFVFVEFSSHRSAAVARRMCSNKLVLWNQKIHVNWAEDEEEIPEDELLQESSLFLRCIPWTISESDLKYGIKNALGSNIHFRIKKLKDFAFIKFTSHHEAEMALSELRDVVIGEYKLNLTWCHKKRKTKPQNSTGDSVQNSSFSESPLLVYHEPKSQHQQYYEHLNSDQNCLSQYRQQLESLYKQDYQQNNIQPATTGWKHPTACLETAYNNETIEELLGNKLLLISDNYLKEFL